MGRGVYLPVPASEIVAKILARDRSGSAPDATQEQLAAWRTDPAICAHLLSLRALHLGGGEGFSWWSALRERGGTAPNWDSYSREWGVWLEHMPNLQDLTVAPVKGQEVTNFGFCLGEDGWQAIGNLTNLQKLCLQDFGNALVCGREPYRWKPYRWPDDWQLPGADSLWAVLKTLTQLTALDLSGTAIADKDEDLAAFARALTRLTGLTALAMSARRKKVSGFQSRDDSPDMRRLVNHPVQLFEAVGRCAALKRLCLNDMGESVCKSPDAVAALAGALRGLTQLIELQLSHNPFSVDAMW